MSPSILLVPVDPLPPRPELETFAARLERVFGRTVRVTDPVRAPAAARLAPDRSAVEPVQAAIAATWGCGCRERLVGVTAAKVVGDEETGRACGSILVLSLAGGQGSGAPLRTVGRYLGLDGCRDPNCAMHPESDAADLCRACRERC